MHGCSMYLSRSSQVPIYFDILLKTEFNTKLIDCFCQADVQQQYAIKVDGKSGSRFGRNSTFSRTRRPQSRSKASKLLGGVGHRQQQLLANNEKYGNWSWIWKNETGQGKIEIVSKGNRDDRKYGQKLESFGHQKLLERTLQNRTIISAEA